MSAHIHDWSYRPHGDYVCACGETRPWLDEPHAATGFRPRDPRLLIAALVCGGIALACLALLT